MKQGNTIFPSHLFPQFAISKKVPRDPGSRDRAFFALCLEQRPKTIPVTEIFKHVHNHRSPFKQGLSLDSKESLIDFCFLPSRMSSSACITLSRVAIRKVSVWNKFGEFSSFSTNSPRFLPPLLILERKRHILKEYETVSNKTERCTRERLAP